MTGEQLEQRWQQAYLCCQAYFAQHGHIRIPQAYVTSQGRHLGVWLNQQRMRQKSGRLLPHRARLLEELQVHWQPEQLRRAQWDVNFELLKAYKQAHGHLLVPLDYVDPCGVKLGCWLSNQRSYYEKGTLLPARRQKLEQLGMVWAVNENRWDRLYQQALCYYKRYGHLDPYANRAQKMDEPVRVWLTRQRLDYRMGRLPEPRRLALEALGIAWNVTDEKWQAMYERARQFFASHGHLLVPKDTGAPEARELGRWVSTQRRAYREQGGQLKDDRVQKLEAIGMVWDASVDIDARWEEWYGRAEAFYRKNGHLNPPAGQLATWVLAQKYKKKGNRGGLSAEQAARLDAIGMVWDVADAQWAHMYQLARAYYHIHEKLNIPAHYTAPGGEQLGNWISRQRTGYKNLKLGLRGEGRPQITPRQVELLNQIEMIWDASVLSTRTSFQERAIHFYLKQQCPDVCKLSQWEPLGCEIDVYLPGLKTGIEYDGRLHADKQEQDERKNRLCLANGIRLIRIREPGLPLLQGCSALIELADLSDAAFEQALARLFEALGLQAPGACIAQHRPAIYASYRDYVTYRWDAIYEQLWAYHQKYDTLPQDPALKSREGTSFLSWLYKQREAYHANELTLRQISKLEKLGFVWAPFQDRWDAMYTLAQAYRQENGHLAIPVWYTAPGGENLGKWLSAQRSNRLAGTLTPRRIQQLDALGIVWAPMKRKHRSMLEAARAYHQEQGHLDVPSTYIDANGVRLGDWLTRMRARQRLGTLNEKTREQLQQLGIKWAPTADAWEEMYQAAQRYHARHGNLWVSPGYVTPEGEPLGEWVSTQRAKYYRKGRHSPLTPEQLQKLEQLGMVWDPYTMKWMLKYNEARLFFEANGHLNVPSSYITESGVKLGMWLCSQRQGLRGNPNFLMTEERKRLLDAIGMNWALKRHNPNARRRPVPAAFSAELLDK